MTTEAPARALPLQVKLVATMVALLVLGLVATGVTASAALHSYLLDRVDSSLSDALHSPDLANPAGRDRRGGRVTAAAGAYYSAILAPDGTPAYSSASTDVVAKLPKLPQLNADEALRRTGHPFTVGAMQDSSSWRVATGVIGGGPYAGGVAVVALGLSDVGSTEHRLAEIELLVGAGALLLLAVAGFLMVRSSLRPLLEVERTAEAIAAGDLSRRVPEQDPRTEVGRLSRVFNTMLGRIETAFAAQQASEAAARASEEKMRRFVADASHELRTPLTSIRGFAELYRMGAVDSPAQLDRNMGRVETEAARMGTLVEDLLLLARLDQQRPLDQSPVDLAMLASDAVHDLRAVARDRVITLTVPPSQESAVVLGDDARLRQVFANLLSNAIVHTPDGTPVSVGVSIEGEEVVVEVTDVGPGMTAQEATRVFERFYRVDVSRARAHGGAGLGLSIVASLVQAHGGAVTVHSAPGEGATFVVRLPRATGPA